MSRRSSTTILTETQWFVGGGSASRNFAYDLTGNKTLAVDRRGRATVYAYDARNQLYSEAWFGSLADANNNSNQLGGLTYSYDLAGRMVQAGSYAYGYDALDRLVGETSSHVPFGVTLTTGFGGRLDGLRQSVAATIGGVADFANQYSYDARLQMTQVLQGGVAGGHAVAPKRVDFAHALDGRLDNITRYADLAGTQTAAQTNFSYDNQDRLTGIHHFKPATGGSTTLAQYGYSYDSAGRINGFSSPDGTAVYAYNDRGELAGADYTGANQPADATYGYDANGNRADAGFTIGGHNQPTTDANFVYTYDAEGNRTSRTSLTTGDYDTYSWDNRNRLIEVTRRAADHTLLWTVDYSYDYQNRMIERLQTIAGQSPSLELFVYDGDQIVLQTDAAGNVTHRYLWGESVDQILADETVDLVSGTSQTKWTLTDHLNAVRDIATYDTATDQTSIIDHIIYDAFGKVASESSPSNSSSLKFTGHYLDPLTGQQWNLNRWYDPGLHQWLSVDPILFEAGDPNPRRYVSNDPVNRVDPSGLAEDPNYGDFRKIAAEWNIGDYVEIHHILRQEFFDPNSSPGLKKWLEGHGFRRDDVANLKALPNEKMLEEGHTGKQAAHLGKHTAKSTRDLREELLRIKAQQEAGKLKPDAARKAIRNLQNAERQRLRGTIDGLHKSKTVQKHLLPQITKKLRARKRSGKLTLPFDNPSATKKSIFRAVDQEKLSFGSRSPKLKLSQGQAIGLAADVLFAEFQYQQLGKSRDASELGEELAGYLTNPAVWFVDFSSAPLAPMVNGANTMDSIIAERQNTYVSLVLDSNSRGIASPQALSKAYGYMQARVEMFSHQGCPSLTQEERFEFVQDYRFSIEPVS
jgi:RHS repeat-associated protein